MTLYALKPSFRAQLRPVARVLARVGVTANQVTVVTALACVTAGVLVGLNADRREWFWAIPILLPIRLAANALDGLIAELRREKTPFGTYLNELGDLLSDAALYLPLAAVAPFSLRSVGAAVALAWVSEFVGVLGEVVSGERRNDGPLGKADRAAVFGALAAVVASTDTLPSATVAIMPVVGILAALTALRRIGSGLRMSALSDSKGGAV